MSHPLDMSIIIRTLEADQRFVGENLQVVLEQQLPLVIQVAKDKLDEKVTVRGLAELQLAAVTAIFESGFGKDQPDGPTLRSFLLEHLAEGAELFELIPANIPAPLEHVFMIKALNQAGRDRYMSNSRSITYREVINLCPEKFLVPPPRPE